jgi:hypothetical protein
MKKEGGWKASNNLSYVGAMEGQQLPSLSDASSLLLHLEMFFVEEGAAVFLSNCKAPPRFWKPVKISLD